MKLQFYFSELEVFIYGCEFFNSGDLFTLLGLMVLNQYMKFIYQFYRIMLQCHWELIYLETDNVDKLIYNFSRGIVLVDLITSNKAESSEFWSFCCNIRNQLSNRSYLKKGYTFYIPINELTTLEETITQWYESPEGSQYKDTDNKLEFDIKPFPVVIDYEDPSFRERMDKQIKDLIISIYANVKKEIIDNDSVTYISIFNEYPELFISDSKEKDKIDFSSIYNKINEKYNVSQKSIENKFKIRSWEWYYYKILYWYKFTNRNLLRATKMGFKMLFDRIETFYKLTEDEQVKTAFKRLQEAQKNIQKNELNRAK